MRWEDWLLIAIGVVVVGAGAWLLWLLHKIAGEL